ncbi:hypothetical protein LV75_001737 [Actinokineospora diospyrosa]|uniref:Uncharacterized protein n=1 Tax=Actinokineospora diospyrosa TaxID=103728 RepID=A0ABT1I9D6_9PSEU|nr:hypothetical protein [Actinokineospora diospyrosa]
MLVAREVVAGLIALEAGPVELCGLHATKVAKASTLTIGLLRHDRAIRADMDAPLFFAVLPSATP